MPNEREVNALHSFIVGGYAWRAQRVGGRAAPIEPELYHQGRDMTMDRYGMRAKGVDGTFGEFDDDGGNQFAIHKPGGGQSIDAGKAMAAYRNFVFAATNAIAREVQNIEWRLFRRKDDALEEVFVHDILDLLDSVNDFQTGPELKFLTSTHMDLTGNAYWYLEGVESELDKPKAIYLLDPSTVKTIIDRSSFPYHLAGYKVRVDSKNISLKPYQVLHIRIPNPSNMFEGIGPVQNIAGWIDNDNYAMEFNRKFFLNGARVAGFLESEYVSPTQLETLKIGFADMHQGVDNMNRIAVLPKGVKWVEAGANPKDMDFRNLSTDMRDRILAGIGVSKTVLGTSESDTNRATAETADYVFAKRVIRPRMQLICSYLNEKLVARYEDDLVLSFVDPVPEDKTYQIEEQKAALANQPWRTVNEIRADNGMEPVEGGDELMRAPGFAPISDPIGYYSLDGGKDGKPVKVPGEHKQQHQTGRKEPNDIRKLGFRPVRTKMAKLAKSRKDMREALEDAVAKKLKEALENPTRKFDATPESVEKARSDLSERAAAAEKELKQIIVELNGKQKTEVISNLGKLAKAQGKDLTSEQIEKLKKLYDLEEWISITTDAVTPVLEAQYSEEGKTAGEAVGVDDLDPLIDVAARDALHQGIALMARSYQESTLIMLAEKLGNGLDQGLSLAELTKSVDDIYEWSDTYRAERVAKTETFRTANSAQREAWKQSGVVKTMKWHTTPGACPFCATLNGKIVDIDENFLNKGDSVSAEVDGVEQSLQIDYSDVGDPPLHPNCNCITRPEDISIE